MTESDKRVITLAERLKRIKVYRRVIGWDTMGNIERDTLVIILTRILKTIEVDRRLIRWDRIVEIESDE